MMAGRIHRFAAREVSERKSLADVTGGADRDRTDDLLSAIQALSQTELQPHAKRARRIARSPRRLQRPRTAETSADTSKVRTRFVVG
jgi:hypothetical protein